MINSIVWVALREIFLSYTYVRHIVMLNLLFAKLYSMHSFVFILVTVTEKYTTLLIYNHLNFSSSSIGRGAELLWATVHEVRDCRLCVVGGSGRTPWSGSLH